MGIFSRISDIVNSNLNALCDSAEDPEKMIRLIIQEMEDTLVEVRSASARVIADQKTASRRRDRIAAEVSNWEDKARLAVSKGRDDLAKAALQERRVVEDTLRIVEGELTSSGDQIGQLNEEIGQLQQKLDDAKAKQKAILLRAKTVQSRVQVKNQVQRKELDDAFARFEGFERKVDNLEGELQAMDLGRNTASSLAAEIDALGEADWLEEELARIKGSMEEVSSEPAKAVDQAEKR
ncbi:phage shock protein PspA [Luminiphilus sp.]|jgi:phage shock protein A|nr:phage shock protein PspA [Luminiphilus sp.]MDA8555267.1 phage shock protein PspA [Luminiphilus sp.]MDA8619400.1 phage shock protein PspA [Luminiphilus sp.]MDB2365576.1 phage shock protein PspA [Luminiphilus sp.]MDC0572617.1 phage shock protein PspA [Luminiphilus sp.]